MSESPNPQVEALIRLMLTRGSAGRGDVPSVTAVSEELGWSRQRFYRTCGPIEALCGEAFEVFADEVIAALALLTRHGGRPATFDGMVRAALDSVAAVLKSDLGECVLLMPRGVQVERLLENDPGSLRGRLTVYAARCAAAHRSRLDDQALLGLADSFVTQVIFRILEHGSDGSVPEVSELCNDLRASFTDRAIVDAKAEVSQLVVEMSIAV